MFPLKDNLPTDRFPFVTAALIVANVLVYFLLQDGGWTLDSNSQGRWPVDDYALVPCELANECASTGTVSDPLTVLTSMFMHGGMLHLAGNMLFLWIFGNNVEGAMGPVKFLAFYLLGGVAADALHTLADPSSAVPTIGASGAVSAVLGGYLVLHPRARIITLVFLIFFFTIIELPAAGLIALWFAQQIVFGLLDYNTAGDGGGVAYLAHVGGFLFGLAAIKLFATRGRRTSPAPYRV